MIKEDILYFFPEGFQIIDSCFNDSDCGLLHGLVDHIKLKKGEKIIQVVLKHEDLTHPPVEEFLRLYTMCIKNEQRNSILTFQQNCFFLSMNDMPEREFGLYNSSPDQLHPFLPDIWGCIKTKSSIYIIMEDLSNYRNINCINTPDKWNEEDISIAVRDIADIHYILNRHFSFYRKQDPLHRVKKFLYEFHSITTYGCGIRISRTVYEAGKKYIDYIELYENRCAPYSQLIHNDFNIRNMCISESDHIKLYDWEFLDVGNPMTDLVDLLLSLDISYIKLDFIENLIEIYYNQYSALTGNKADHINYKMYFVLFCDAAQKYAATRMNMYLLCYKENALLYIERMYYNLELILQLCMGNDEGGERVNL